MKLSFKKIILFLVVICVFVINHWMWIQRKTDNQSKKLIETTMKTVDTITTETTSLPVEENTELTSKTTISKPKETTTAIKESTEEIKLDVTTEPATKKETDIISLGEFKLTAYCSCSKCCGKWAGSPTASGVMPRANHTIAVDTSVIPFGTKVKINGNTYVAEDTGSAIKGNKIDIYFDSHKAAKNFGVQYVEVFLINN